MVPPAAVMSIRNSAGARYGELDFDLITREDLDPEFVQVTPRLRIHVAGSRRIENHQGLQQVELSSVLKKMEDAINALGVAEIERANFCLPGTTVDEQAVGIEHGPNSPLKKGLFVGGHSRGRNVAAKPN